MEETMYTKCGDIDRYLDYLNNEMKLPVSVHFKPDVFAEFPKKVMDILWKYNCHNDPYCIMVKSTQMRKCLWCQRRILKRHESEFFGVCHAGVPEYIHLFDGKNGTAGFISVSGEPKKGDSPGEMPDEKTCRALIPPLAGMMSALSENIGEGEDVEYKLMLNYIAMNHHVSLDDLCGQFHRSRSYISHMFGKKCGMTLPAYCNRLKIEDAKELLKKTDMPITEIAYSAGFGDVSYFINLFGKMTGITPLKWRKLNK